MNDAADEASGCAIAFGLWCAFGVLLLFVVELVLYLNGH